MNNDLINISNLAVNKSNFTYKELKKNCITRGMKFSEVIGCDFPNLANWLLHNFTNEIINNKLEEFDDWIDEELKKNGKDYLIHPSLRLGYLGEKSKTNIIEDDKKDKVVKVKRERNSNGLYKGTKKSYTFELQSKGKTLQQVIKKVTRKFPEAKEKSIKIWFNRSRKENVKNN